MTGIKQLCLALLMAATGPALAGEDAMLRAPVQSFRLPGDAGWDYVTYDPTQNRAFIGRFDGLQVVSVKDGKLLATLSSPTGAHGAALAPEADRLVTSDIKGNRLTVFSLSTLQRIGTVPLPGAPDGLMYDRKSGHFLAFVPGQHQVVAVDPVKVKAVRQVDVGAEPEAGVSDSAGAVFVTLPNTGEVVRLQGDTLAIAARWKTGCLRPSPIAIDPSGQRLFVGCRDRRMRVMNASDGRVIATVAIGEGADSAVYDPRSKMVAIASGDGRLTFVRDEGGDRYALAGTIAVPRGARTMALDAEGGRLLTVTAEIVSVEPPTSQRPYPLVHAKPSTFRLIALSPTGW